MNLKAVQVRQVYVHLNLISSPVTHFLCRPLMLACVRHQHTHSLLISSPDNDLLYSHMGSDRKLVYCLIQLIWTFFCPHIQHLRVKSISVQTVMFPDPKQVQVLKEDKDKTLGTVQCLAQGCFHGGCFFFSIYTKLVQGYDPLTFVLYPHCTIYVLDLPIKCNTLMLNFSRAEYVREGGQGSLLSAHQLLSVKTWAVGLWLKDHRETLISVGYWASSQALNFPFVSFKVDTPQPITLESDFTNSTVPSSASKELNSFVRFFCQLFGPQVFSWSNKLVHRKKEEAFVQRSSQFVHSQQTHRTCLLWSTCICCCCAPQAYLQTLIAPAPSPTLSYKSQVCKHKGLPRSHKR